MGNHTIIYFSVNRQKISEFNDWVKIRTLKWFDESGPDPNLKDLPQLICKQKDKALLYVIIDYLSLIESTADRNQYDEMVAQVHRIILQFPEVNFLFDQSNLKENDLTWTDFIFGGNSKVYASEIAQGFHIFRKEDGFVFSDLGYDNLFDGSNLRWAVRKKYYEDLELENVTGNFEKLQTARKRSLAVVVDDEPRQSRFNGYALYASGYHVIPVCTARMLLALNSEPLKKMPQTTLKIIVRDFDLQFPDASKRLDYDEMSNTYKNVIYWDDAWRVIIKEEEVDITPFGSDGKMIDSIRNYRFKENCSDSWKITPNTQNPFWAWAEEKEIKEEKEKIVKAPMLYVVTNGHDKLHISHKKYDKWKINCKDKWLEVRGLEKPVSGLYYPFFTKFKDVDGNFVVKEHFEGTRYGIKDKEKYGINKKRKDHHHGVPIGIYDTVCEMLHRAEQYNKNKRYVKAAIVAQEAIELLNGFHYQMMIKAYHLKFLAENNIAMNIIGANERQLVLDAEQRVEIMKNDIHRIVYPLNKGESNKFIKDFVTLIRRRKKEHELLGHIFSDCRDTCRDNEYFDVESVFIREMAHLDQRDLGIIDLIRYIKHRIFMHKLNKEEER